MADKPEATITMSVAVLNKIIKLNRSAYEAVSEVGGNSVQDGYKRNTQSVLDQQQELLEIFVPEDDG